MPGREYPLSLTIRAVDKATATLRLVNERIQGFTAPVRRANNSFRALSAEAGLPRVASTAGDAGRAIWGIGGAAAGAAVRLGALVGIGGGGLYAIVRHAVDAGDKLGEMAQRVGLSVDAYAQLQAAAAQADVDQEQFNSAMDRFNKSLGEAKAGGGSMLAFLEKVSPRLALQVRGAKSTEEALSLMTSAFEKVQDPAKRAALAGAVFGKSGLQMGQFLGQGNKAIGEQRRHFLEGHGSMEAYARVSGELDNAMRETGWAFGALASTAGTELFPALTEVAKAATTLLAGERGRIGVWARDAAAAISGWVKDGSMAELAGTMKTAANAAQWLYTKIGGLKGVLVLTGVYITGSLVGALWTAVGAMWSLGAAAVAVAARIGLASVATSGWLGYLWMMKGYIWTAIVGHLAAASTAVWGFTAALLANPITWVVAGVAAFAAAAYLVYKHWEPIKKFFEELWGTIRSVFGVTGGDAAGGRLSLGASSMAPGAGGVGMQAAHVTVDFANVPKGVRVSADPKSTAELDLSMGYSMAASH